MSNLNPIYTLQEGKAINKVKGFFRHIKQGTKGGHEVYGATSRKQKAQILRAVRDFDPKEASNPITRGRKKLWRRNMDVLAAEEDSARKIRLDPNN